MFAGLLLVGEWLLDWALSAGVMKWVFSAVIWFGIAMFLDLLLSLLPSWLDTTAVGTAFGGITPQIWYFLDIFQLQTGIAYVFAAYATRFLIRRIPFIG
jgi:hypothetical protein